jgi:glycosyltransferase involved in cell wall biosynthesis
MSERLSMNFESLKKLRIAFVHDWLTGMRGGENVLEEMIEVLGVRDIYTLVAVPENLSKTLNSCPIQPSFIQKLPGATQHHQLYLPLFPMAIESMDLSDYDLVISTSHCVARGCVTRAVTFHWSYIHTPIRYAWDFSQIYQKNMKPRWLMSWAWPLTMHYLRLWDVGAVSRVDHYACNAKNIERRIKKYYGRGSEVLYPPVDTDYFKPCDNPSRDYYLVLGALVPYKRANLALEVCKNLDRPLKIAGSGPETERLRQAAYGTKIEFIGSVSREEARKLFQNAKAFLFPGEEDFGITPLEAQACGTPVIAFGAGGALETVLSEQTGLFFSEQTTQSLSETILDFEKKDWVPAKARDHSLKFSKQVFQEGFRKSLLKAYLEFSGSGTQE